MFNYNIRSNNVGFALGLGFLALLFILLDILYGLIYKEIFVGIPESSHFKYYQRKTKPFQYWIYLIYMFILFLLILTMFINGLIEVYG